MEKQQDVHLALLANGYESGFSTCWPPGSRLILDLFEDAWRDSTGEVAERLAVSFQRARATFVTEAPALITEEADFPDDAPAAALLAVAMEGSTAHAAWIGGDVAVLARGFESVAETTPHTLREKYRREHPQESANLANVPNVLLRMIGPRAPER